jgi:hypothetical protein
VGSHAPSQAQPAIPAAHHAPRRRASPFKHKAAPPVPQTLNLAGIFKDVLLIGLSVALYRSTVTSLQLLGYGVALGGVLYYNWHKFRPGGAQQQQQQQKAGARAAVAVPAAAMTSAAGAAGAAGQQAAAEERQPLLAKGDAEAGGGGGGGGPLAALGS